MRDNEWIRACVYLVKQGGCEESRSPAVDVYKDLLGVLLGTEKRIQKDILEG